MGRLRKFFFKLICLHIEFFADIPISIEKQVYAKSNFWWHSIEVDLSFGFFLCVIIIEFGI